MDGILPYLGRDELALLRPKLQLARAKEGQRIIREGAPSPALFIIQSGEVDILRANGAHEIHVITLGKDIIFGESAFLDSLPASASARARSDTDLIVLNPQKIRPLFDESPQLFSLFYRSLALLVSRKLRMATNDTATAHAPEDPFGDLPSWEIL